MPTRSARKDARSTSHFGLPSPALVEKDFHVVKALAAIAAIETAPLGLVFGGGYPTNLYRVGKVL